MSFGAFSAARRKGFKMPYRVAAIDVHKKVLVVVVAEVREGEPEWTVRRFGTGAAELQRLAEWLEQEAVAEAVMESTAQYWKPVWLALEPQMRLHLAQAQSNRAPKGRKTDARDAERLWRRFVAGELMLSFVPDAGQRAWRMITRTRLSLVRERVQVRNQIESLLEEGGIKLAAVVSDLLGMSGRRILQALARGETDPETLAGLGEATLRCGRQALADALTGRMSPVHCALLAQHLERIALLDRQIEHLSRMAAEQMQPWEDALRRLVEVPGIGADAAQDILAEVGPTAAAFPTPGQMASWTGVCPGSQQSAGRNASGRSAKGNPNLRRVLTQAAHAAVRTKGSFFEHLFRRLVVRLGYAKALWAVAHKLCRIIWKILHEGVHYIERGDTLDPRTAQRRIQHHLRMLRKLGYPLPPNPSPAAQ